jgi:signal transduction histidine kinase/DNA-binding response OmpR family regulator
MRRINAPHQYGFYSSKLMDTRILIIDDSRAVVESLNYILSNQGYQTEHCGDGISGWRRLVAGADRRAPMPDLLLLDLNMPGTDGMTLLRRLRADERFALLPVIILTVEADSVTRLEALKAGANDYLPKPVQAVELLARVQALLGLKLAERRQQQRMERLVEAGRALLSTHDLKNVLRHVMQIAVAEMDAEGTSIWLQMPDGSLGCQAAYGKNTQDLLGLRLEPGQGIAGWALKHRQPVLVSDAQDDSRLFRKADEKTRTRTQNIIAVPLFVRETGVGVLEAVNKKQGLFSTSDLAWMEVLAPLAAAAIANAQLFEMLRQRTAELQTRNEDLDAYAHTVAHDLKSPLAQIVGFSEALEQDWSSLSEDELQHYLWVMARNGRKMSRIIDELLLLAGIRKMDIESEPLNMESIVAEATSRLADLIEEHQVEITLPETWPMALGYGPWVEEMWINYISNAIRYGGRPPRIELGAAAQENGTVQFYVRDNGQGLTSEAQARLFKPFTRLDQVRTKGYGLGLSIVRRIAEKLGGHVGVRSQVGRGSIFTFTLPSEGKHRSAD